LQQVFDTLINSYIQDKVGISENFLSVPLAAHLKQNLQDLYSSDHMIAAGTSNTTVNHDKLFRSDIIHWLDRSHENIHENNFFNLMDKFVLHLNTTCYTGITGYEFHYSLYQPDCFYKKHLDQFKNNDSRKFSMIIYLNEGWEIKDGGELCIYHSGYTQNISPENGKTVFFKSSELEHEVLITHKDRMSITGWLKS
jgi:SM-20-related protein